MRKNKQETTEYIPTWDAGSYQTGAAKPPRHENRMITFLLIVVICLGGLASAFGVLNFRLLSMMEENGNSITPLNTYLEPETTTVNAFLSNHNEPVPVIPEQRELEMSIDENLQNISVDETFQHNENALVSVYCSTYCGELLSGTGIVMSEDGYILTNAHIIEAAQRVFVYLSDEKLVRAAIVGSDPFTDMAVLYVDVQGLQAALFSNTDQLAENSQVFAPKSQPDADHNFMLSGHTYDIISLSTGDLTVDILQSSLWGNSGPVYNSNGQIVAVRAGKISRYFDDNPNGNNGIAIPTEAVQSVAQEIIENGFVKDRPSIRIQVETISKLYQHYWELPGGLMVTDIDENSNAALQGMKEGDILLTLDGVQMTSRADFYATVYQAEIGDELIAVIFRDGRRFTITLTVEETVG